jgi:hypothetical protein
VFPRDMVCLRNTSVDTLHKGDTEDDDDDDDDDDDVDDDDNIIIISTLSVSTIHFEKQLNCCEKWNVDDKIVIVFYIQ